MSSAPRTLAIREAGASDAEVLSALALSASHLVVRDPTLAPGFFAQLSPEAFAARMASGEYTHVLGHEVGTPVGYLAMRGSHLFHLFVSPEWHGRGIGRALWGHASVSHEVGRFTVNASLGAVSFYKALGFVATAPASCAEGIEFVPMALDRGG